MNHSYREGVEIQGTEGLLRSQGYLVGKIKVCIHRLKATQNDALMDPLFGRHSQARPGQAPDAHMAVKNKISIWSRNARYLFSFVA